MFRLCSLVRFGYTLFHLFNIHKLYSFLMAFWSRVAQFKGSSGAPNYSSSSGTLDYSLRTNIKQGLMIIPELEASGGKQETFSPHHLDPASTPQLFSTSVAVD